MRTVHEVSRLTGVSVRTLHHYDAIGLLAPTQLTEAGYRLYDDAALQRYITEHYYACTAEILAGLGQMYTADERFRANIDRAGGEGTAQFAAAAIAEYCK